MGLLLAIALSTPSVDGQVVVGHVVEEGTLRPLAGAWVVLQDTAGHRVAAVLADGEGRFILAPDQGGEFRLVARLIGYQDSAGEYFRLAEGETIQRTLSARVRAVSLQGIRVRGEQRCHGRPSGDAQVATLWEEARKALEIAEWAEEHGALRFHIIEHRRELDASSFRVTKIQEEAVRALYDGSPYVSRPAQELSVRGYVQAAADAPGDWDYWGPDGEVLLSEVFLDAHCFRVHPRSDDRRVGLAFEPIRGRTLPDVEGVLWLDRSTAELEQLEFRYVNLPFERSDWPQVGGLVEFERLSTGVWIVSQWYIRMPLEARTTGGFEGSQPEVTLQTLTEEGAHVVKVETLTGATLSESVGATLYGVVTAEGSEAPLEGAAVELVPTGRRAVSNEAGVYRLSGLPDGTFEVRVTHPWLDRFGGDAITREVTLEAGRARRLAVEADLERAAIEFCATSNPAPADPMAVHGTVIDLGTGEPLAGALVAIRSLHGERSVTTDSTGAYLVCLERGDVEVAVVAVDVGERVRFRAYVSGTRLRPPTGVLARTDLELDPAALTATVPSETVGHLGSKWSNAMIGTVIDATDGDPIPGATVVVRDEDGVPLYSVVTNPEGQFRFLHHSQHVHVYDVTVEHAAYGRANRQIEFRPAEQLHIEVVMSRRAQAETRVAVAGRRPGVLVESGFYERMEAVAGIFIQREEIEARAPSSVTELLEGRPGIRVVTAGPEDHDVRLFAPQRPDRACEPSIWLDGARVRTSRPVAPAAPDTREPGAGSPSLNQVASPEGIEGLEIYVDPNEAPTRFLGDTAPCGVVVIWTRR